MTVQIEPEVARGGQVRREKLWAEDVARPYFFWDRRITAAELRAAIASDLGLSGS